MTPGNVPVAQYSVADLVQAALTKQGLSIREVAARTDGAVSHSQVARIARGESATVRPQTLGALAKALGIPLGKLRAANGWEPAVGRPFVLPERADELSIAERRLIVSMVGALLAAHDRAR